MADPRNADRKAHEVEAPNGNRFIAKSGAVSYENNPEYKVTPVQGHDDPQGRGFVVTQREAGR